MLWTPPGSFGPVPGKPGPCAETATWRGSNRVDLTSPWALSLCPGSPGPIQPSLVWPHQGCQQGRSLNIWERQPPPVYPEKRRDQQFSPVFAPHIPGGPFALGSCCFCILRAWPCCNPWCKLSHPPRPPIQCLAQGGHPLRGLTYSSPCVSSPGVCGPLEWSPPPCEHHGAGLVLVFLPSRCGGNGQGVHALSPTPG